MLSKLYVKACDAFPRFRKFTRKHMYQFMAKIYQKEDWTFMNYGYVPLEQGEDGPDLSHDDEINRYCIQLYHHLASAVNLNDQRVLVRMTGSPFSGPANTTCRLIPPTSTI